MGSSSKRSCAHTTKFRLEFLHLVRCFSEFFIQYASHSGLRNLFANTSLWLWYTSKRVSCTFSTNFPEPDRGIHFFECTSYSHCFDESHHIGSKFWALLNVFQAYIDLYLFTTKSVPNFCHNRTDVSVAYRTIRPSSEINRQMDHPNTSIAINNYIKLRQRQRPGNCTRANDIRPVH